MADVTLTLAEAIEVLEPPVTIRRLRTMVRKRRLKPQEYRYTGHPGRPAPAYNATRLMQLHAEIVSTAPRVVS